MFPDALSTACGRTFPSRRSLLRLGAAVAWPGWGVTQGAGRARAQTALPALSRATGFYANFKGLKLQDQDGRTLQVQRLMQHLVLVNFVYTGCATACPVQTRALVELQQQLPAALRQRVQLLSVSIDPLNDSPQALRAFGLRLGVDFKGWTMATGRPEDIERIAEALRLFRPGADARKPEDHSTGLWLVDTQGQLRMRYSGNPPDVARLLREITVLDGMAGRGQS